LLPAVFGLLVCAVFLCCVSADSVEDGGFRFVCFFSFCADASMRCGFPGGVRMRESASRSWNKVLRASLFFTVVCSDGGVGSGSLGLPGSEVSVQALGSSSLCTEVFSSLTDVLVLGLGLLVLRSGSSGFGCFVSMAVEGGEGAKSKRPTAAALSTEISCSLPMFEVRPLIWTCEFGGLKLLCAVSMPLLWCRRYVWRRKTNSRVLGVISALLRDFAVRLRCTVLLRF